MNKRLILLNLQSSTPTKKPLCRQIMNNMRTRSTTKPTPTVRQNLSNFKLGPTLSPIQTSSSAESKKYLPQNKLSRLQNLEQEYKETDFDDQVGRILTSRILQQSISRVDKFEVRNIFDQLRDYEEQEKNYEEVEIEGEQQKQSKFDHIFNQITGISPDQIHIYEKIQFALK